ncbi:hypothetical protein H0274_14320 [Altererythrobacter sp. CC-YST694]|uniref:hypothetical protein n=1 Tax=Altererythrobacter sp. CC-YST694 TaxID=2755038 RepID=UPI001D02BFED|nr:hypothetical protein [Altererythrobacter sp. CC-YST694]MCB5426436.1 hypothetical protein [Altererythrobacter sp. CC-YST694]
MGADLPDGISPSHLEQTRSAHALSHWLALLVLGALMIAALAGLFGGWPSERKAALRNGASLAVEAPQILRSGEFFEIWIEVRADRPLEKPTLAISPAYLRNLTVNTVMPGAEEEAYSGDALTMGYGRLEAGQPLRIKLDGQVNPTLAGGHDGWMELREGDTRLVRIPLALEILP